MSKPSFDSIRRQPYINEVAYINTRNYIDKTISILEEKDCALSGDQQARSFTRSFIAQQRWFEFQLRYTAGEPMSVLASSLTSVVETYERYVESLNQLSDDDYRPPFQFNDLIDIYVDYVNLLCACVLFRREDLISRVAELNRGTDFDGVDAVIEELFKLYLEERPHADELYWEKPYAILLEAVDSEETAARREKMEKYIKAWYKSMKGRAHFWGAHETIKPEFSPYCGYWDMCSAAFTYLYDIDDIRYRNEVVYPKDMVDYARSTGGVDKTIWQWREKQHRKP